MILEVVQSKWSLTWYDLLGPRMCVLELMNGHVLQTLREQLKVPGSRLEGNELLTSEFLRFRSRLNETSGGLGKISAVSACSCPTELISGFLDKKMAPFAKSLPTYIKDTNHALNILKQFSFPSNNKFLFTMDIISLYTVIPNNEGLLALKYFFDQRTVKEPSTDTLLRLAELVLTLNCFTFSGEIFKQINGVAMGTKMGPNYANLFVGYVEEQIFNQFDGPKPELFGRYIDDCLGATSCTKEELERFIGFVNSFHPALKFTWEISKTSVTFLDINISVQDNKLATRVHYKPTDSHSYLLYSSSHPSHVKDSIP